MLQACKFWVAGSVRGSFRMVVCVYSVRAECEGFVRCFGEASVNLLLEAHSHLQEVWLLSCELPCNLAPNLSASFREQFLRRGLYNLRSAVPGLLSSNRLLSQGTSGIWSQ